MYVTKFEREWDLWMHASAFVHNTSAITGTDGLTPFFLIFGREPFMPTDVMLAPVVTMAQNQKTYDKDLTARLFQAREYMAAIARTSTETERLL